MNAKIIGIGSYLPERVLTNKDLEKMVDTSDEWIVTRTGVRERRIAKKDEASSDLGVLAAKEAILDANISEDDVDLIIVATLTPDYMFPSTACMIQKKLKAFNAAAVDIQAACSGYIYALSFAKALIEKKVYKNILIVASEKLSSIVDYEDRSTCVLFGDGASSCIVSLEGEGFEIKSVSLGADGEQSDLLIMPAGGSKNPTSLETLKNRDHYIKMSGKEVFKHAVRRMLLASENCLKLAEIEEKDIDWVIPHQANKRIIEAIAKRFKHLDKNKIFQDVIEKYGNTSASSVGIALDEIKKNIKKGEKILITAFGAGFTWGGCVLER